MEQIVETNVRNFQKNMKLFLDQAKKSQVIINRGLERFILTLEKNVGKTEEKTPKIKFDFESIYKKYPKKEGKKRGLASCVTKIKTVEQYNDLKKSVDNYYDRCVFEETEKSYIKHFSTFMNCYEDYIDIEIPKSIAQLLDEIPAEGSSADIVGIPL